MDSKNTRVSTNALVFYGTSEISKDVVRRIKKLLHSSDLNQAIAGVFAWGEISKHHLTNDPVYFRTQSEFLALAKEFRSLLERFPSSDVHIRDAVQKSGDAALVKYFENRPAV